MKKNIAITGGSKGLGLAITKTLLENNYNVYIINRSENENIFELKNNYKDELNICKFDLSNLENIHESIFEEFLPLKTPIHGFVNNAAFAYDDIITNIQLNPLEDMYRLNVYAPMIMTKYIIRNMLYNKIEGGIVHISSISVHTGYKGLAMYASTKGALEAFSKNTAREWGERGIRSNCIVAGFMETEMTSRLSNDQKNRIYKRTSLKKPTSKMSVANNVEFLLSDRANSVTGQNIFVDSGTI